MYRLFVNGLEFYGYHGVPPEEQVVGHRYIMDLELEVAGTADRTDRVEDTVDYGKCAELALKVAQTERCHTIERLATLIAERLLGEFAALASVVIHLAKRLPPAPIIAEEAAVEIELRR